jgi:uncharacterized protein YjiS (DUF1127 family)
MSIPLTDKWSIPPVQATDSAPPLHQSSSGKPSVRARGWLRWIGRQDERIALREIAENPHLLQDLGLSREEVLREAAKPFWR